MWMNKSTDCPGCGVEEDMAHRGRCPYKPAVVVTGNETYLTELRREYVRGAWDALGIIVSMTIAYAALWCVFGRGL